jgi:large subunit ribosomal protein L23
MNITSNKSAATVLVHPIMSEKAMQAEMLGQYTFYVANNATKVDVKRAIAEVYGVVPTRVRMLNVDGKTVRFGKFIGRRTNTKKAIVTLPKGKTIAIHEGV